MNKKIVRLWGLPTRDKILQSSEMPFRGWDNTPTPFKRTSSKLPPAFQSYKPRTMKVFGSICINANGEVLLVKSQGGKWSFPKGHCEGGQETDLECARRELYEETSVVAPSKYLSVHKLRGGTYFIFAFEGATPTAQPIDTREIESCHWWPLLQLPEKDMNVDVSIFRTLMKSLPVDKSTLEFIESDESHRKSAIITRHIVEAEESIAMIPVQIPVPAKC